MTAGDKSSCIKHYRRCMASVGHSNLCAIRRNTKPYRVLNMLRSDRVMLLQHFSTSKLHFAKQGGVIDESFQSSKTTTLSPQA